MIVNDPYVIIVNNNGKVSSYKEPCRSDAGDAAITLMNQLVEREYKISRLHYGDGDIIHLVMEKQPARRVVVYVRPLSAGAS